MIRCGVGFLRGVALYFLAGAIFLLRLAYGDLVASDWAVQVTASVSTNPPQIELSWPGDIYAKSYKVFRKLRDEREWILVGDFGGTATTFTDWNVTIGNGYEYKIEKVSTGGQETWTYNGYGYIYAGGMLPLIEQRGKVIVLVEASVAQALKTELERFEFELIADGWTVVRETVDASDSPPTVKAKVQRIYAEDPATTRALLLFGHVPVPYSGDISPDEHPPYHTGAWPADTYYADLDGTWTDTSVTDTGAEKDWNWNIPGDGKFDQSDTPSFVELEVGRVDLSNMTCFANKTPSLSEIDLMRRYLDKEHKFRTGMIHPPQRALIYDLFGIREPEGYVASMWRTYAPLLDRNVDQAGESEFFDKIGSNWYLWSSVTSGGTFVGSVLAPNTYYLSDQFAIQEINAVFTTFLGSWFGDWDNESNFLRAALGSSGGVLTSAYAGKPQWLFHHMALGETIGFATKVTQNNRTNGPYLPKIIGTGQVHIGLMGDPTLRMHPLEPVRNLIGATTFRGISLSWEAPTIANLQGYHVYKASNAKGPYERITSQLQTSTSYTVPGGKSDEFFMVKPVALTETPSGSYFNSGMGSYYPDPMPINHSPVANNLTIDAISGVATSIELIGSDPEDDMLSYRIVSSPKNGQLAGTGRNFTYTSTSGYNGSDSFTYSASDGNSDSAAATVTIMIVATNKPPVSSSLSLEMVEDRSLAIRLAGFDPEGDSISFRITNPPIRGSLSGTGPNLTYTPEIGVSGSDSFAYVASDGTNDSAVAIVTILIKPSSTSRRISGVRMEKSGLVSLQIQGPPQEQFRIQSSSDGKTWVPRDEQTSDPNGIGEFRESNGGERLKLYRISWP